MKETCKSLKSLIDAAYMHGFDAEGFTFVLVMDLCCSREKRKMFYFHKAKVTEWGVPVFFPKDGPAKVVLESDSGLQLVYHKELGLSVINTKRFSPSYRNGYVRKTHVRYEQSMRNHEVTFYRVS